MKNIVSLILVCLAPIAAAGPNTSPSALLQFRLVSDGPSEGAEQMTITSMGADGGKEETLYVNKKVLLDQTAVTSAVVSELNSQSGPSVFLRLTDQGRKQFAEVTRENVGKRLAIVVDGRLYSAPVIRDEISVGTAVITGTFSETEAELLAAKIRESIEK